MVIAMLLVMVSVVMCEQVAPRDALSGHWVRRPRPGPSPRIQPGDDICEEGSDAKDVLSGQKAGDEPISICGGRSAALRVERL